MRRRVIGWVVAAAATGVALGCNKNEDQPTTGAARPVAACGFDGVEAAITAAKGKVVLVDCWATWCGPCVAGFPKLVQKHDKYAGQGLAVISVSLDDESDVEDVDKFLAKKHAAFTNLLLRQDRDSARGMAEKLAFDRSIPHAVLFDRTGKRVWAGHPEDDELDGLIKSELAK